MKSFPPLSSFPPAIALMLLMSSCLLAKPPAPTRVPLVRVLDLDLGEAATVTLSDGSTARVQLLEIDEIRDPIRNAIRSATVTVEVNGEKTTLHVGNYHLPVSFAGVQIDCSLTSGYYQNTNQDRWGLEKDARLRLWPAGSPMVAPGTFAYPVKQRWFASGTQFSNEPTFVDGGEIPSNKKVYYHNDLDFGGCEGMVEVVAAADALVVSAGDKLLDGYSLDTPARPRYDVVYLLDDRGWYYRYSHLFSTEVEIGQRVKMGERIGLLGKEGSSGGWSHLHFGLVSRQPSGKWGTQEGYAFVWEAWLNENQPEVIAVARPHHLVSTGTPVTLDGGKSWCATGTLKYEWTLSDGESAGGSKVVRTYEKAGTYSEILKVTDEKGNVSFDFAVVQVIDRAHEDLLPPTIQAAYAPSIGLKVGETATFKVRTFRTTEGSETWDFGDGSPTVEVRSDGGAVKLAKDGFAVTAHTYSKPGNYIVRVERTNDRGETATAHLWVPVGM
jgi:hypothetical protein